MTLKPVTREAAVARLVELFRIRGYEGLSLSAITAATGLGKGSLYNFFPGGKAEMGEAALSHIDAWFEGEVFAPLRAAPDPRAGVAAMLEAVERYFLGGRRACLVAVFALDGGHDVFAGQVAHYFGMWLAALSGAHRKMGLAAGEARAQAEEVLAVIQGALLLARADDSPAIFKRQMERLKGRYGAGSAR